jgi:hypothetical protein
VRQPSLAGTVTWHDCVTPAFVTVSRETAVLGAILNLVAGDVIAGLRARWCGKGHGTDERHHLNLHPVHGKATRLAGAAGAARDAASHWRQDAGTGAACRWLPGTGASAEVPCGCT